MYSAPLGQSLNYGQSMQPGKAGRPAPPAGQPGQQQGGFLRRQADVYGIPKRRKTPPGGPMQREEVDQMPVRQPPQQPGQGGQPLSMPNGIPIPGGGGAGGPYGGINPQGGGGRQPPQQPWGAPPPSKQAPQGGQAPQQTQGPAPPQMPTFGGNTDFASNGGGNFVDVDNSGQASWQPPQQQQQNTNTQLNQSTPADMQQAYQNHQQAYAQQQQLAASGQGGTPGWGIDQSVLNNSGPLPVAGGGAPPQYGGQSMANPSVQFNGANGQQQNFGVNPNFAQMMQGPMTGNPTAGGGGGQGPNLAAPWTGGQQPMGGQGGVGNVPGSAGGYGNAGSVDHEGIYTAGSAPDQIYNAQNIPQWAYQGYGGMEQQQAGLLQQMMASGGSMNPQIVAQMKGANRDEASLLQQQMSGQMGNAMAARGMNPAGGGQAAALQRALQQQTGSQVLGGNRDIDINAAQTNWGDQMQAIGAGTDFQNAAMGRATQGYQNTMQGIGENRNEQMANLDSIYRRFGANQGMMMNQASTTQGAIGNRLQGQSLSNQMNMFGQQMEFDREKFGYGKEQDALGRADSQSAQADANNRWADSQAYQYQQDQEDQWAQYMNMLFQGGNSGMDYGGGY